MMSKDNAPEYGARIERGTISYALTDGWYKVASIERPGVTTVLKTMNDYEPDEGETVWFFVCEDGKGKILAAVDG